MVDVYLATYNSKKGLFGSKKQVAEDIVQNPQNYHIYDGMSAMTNISRYVEHFVLISTDLGSIIGILRMDIP